MRNRSYKGLIALNAALLSALALVTFVPTADGQRGRNRGEYTMVGGQVQGVAESALWIVDASNQDMLVLRWNNGQKKIEAIGYRNLSVDQQRARGQVR